jgi:general secretion pathway protein C
VIRTLLVERLSPLGRWLPTDIYFWMRAILLALIAIHAAGLLWAVVTPAGPFGPWQPAPARTLSGPAQSALFASVDPFFRTNGPAESGPLAPDLQLFGLRGSQGAVPASAILGTADGEQKSYVVGEEVAPGIKLAAVGFDHVILSRGTARQTLYMQGADEAAPVAAPAAAGAGSAAPTVTASNAAQAFALSPRNQGGRVTGIQVASGANPALFNAAGFRPGDVIVAVNGARISSAVDVQQFQYSIVPGARLMLTVERGAQAIPIALNIPGNP